MPHEITVDFTEQVYETQTKIARLQSMIHDIENKKHALEIYKKDDVFRLMK